MDTPDDTPTWVMEIPYDSADWALDPGEVFDDPPRVATEDQALAHEGHLIRQGRKLLTPTKPKDESGTSAS